MNKKNSPTVGHNKKSLLKSEVEHIDITSFDSRKIKFNEGSVKFQ